MQRADFRVVLDACALANASVCNVLLSLAETPRLYLPKWSQAILAEVHRTHINKLGWDSRLADSFQEKINQFFPEALVEQYEHLVDHCSNDPKDRHVLACAIHCRAELILTFNIRDFPEACLEPWQIQVLHPQDYLMTLYSIDPVTMIHRLGEIARKRNMDLETYLLKLGKWLPLFTGKILSHLQLGG